MSDWMNDYKLIALDIDGTTIVRGEKMSEQNQHWIREAIGQGIDVTFATGRHRLGMVSEYVDELGISVPFVTLNGGEVWTPAGQLLARHAIDAAHIPFLHQLGQKYDVHYWGTTAKLSMNRDNFPRDLDFGAETWIKFGYYTEDMSLLAKIWAELEEFGGFSLSNSDPFNVEVNALGATKATGLQTAIDYLGIESQQVVVMGDSLNDIPMFQWAGLAVAMGNAQESVKQAAHRVTETCDKHGVARTIEHILKTM